MTTDSALRASVNGPRPADGANAAGSTLPGVPAAPLRSAAAPRRRRPTLLALGVALVALGALVVVYVVGQVGDRQQVLAVARNVAVGQVVAADDLVVAGVANDPDLRPVPASALGEMVGKVAAVDLRAGSLLTLDSVTDRAMPSGQEQLVPLPLKSGQLPARGLQAGERVLVVQTPADSGSSTEPTGTPIPATVVDVGAPDENGVTTVDVVVDSPNGPLVATRAGTGRVAVVVLPRGG